MFGKAIERIVASKGAYLPKTHKDTVLSMSISDEDTDAGSDFIELQKLFKCSVINYLYINSFVV
jgi:hypothetical protein